MKINSKFLVLAQMIACIAFFGFLCVNGALSNTGRQESINQISFEKKYYLTSKGNNLYYVFHKKTVDVFVKLSDQVYDVSRIVRTNKGERGLHTCSESRKGKYTYTVLDPEISMPASIKLSSINNPSYGYSIYDRAAIDPITVAKENEYYHVLRSAPVVYKSHTVLIDWSKCKKYTACTDLNFNSEDEIYNVESDGMILKNANSENLVLKISR